MAVKVRNALLQPFGAYSMFLRIYPSMNNLAPSEVKNPESFISVNGPTGTSLHCVKKTSFNTLLISHAGGSSGMSASTTT